MHATTFLSCALSTILGLIVVSSLLSLPSSCEAQAPIYTFSGAFENQPLFSPPSFDNDHSCQVDPRDSPVKYALFTYTFPTDGLRRLFIYGFIFSIVDSLYLYKGAAASFNPKDPCAGNPTILYNSVRTITAEEWQSIHNYTAGTYTFIIQSAFSKDATSTGYFTGSIYDTEYKSSIIGIWKPPRSDSYSGCDTAFGISSSYGTFTWTAPATDLIAISGYRSSSSTSYMNVAVYKGAFNDTYLNNQCSDFITIGDTSNDVLAMVDQIKVVRGEVYSAVLSLNILFEANIGEGIGFHIGSSGYRTMSNISDAAGFTEPTRYNGANSLATIACLDNSTFNDRPYAAFVFNNVVPETWFYVELDKSVSNYEYSFFWYTSDNSGSSSSSPITCRSSNNDVPKEFAFLGYSSYVGGFYYASVGATYTLIATPYRRQDAAMASGSWSINVKYNTGNLITQGSMPSTTTSNNGRTTSNAAAKIGILSSLIFVMMMSVLSLIVF